MTSLFSGPPERFARTRARIRENTCHANKTGAVDEGGCTSERAAAGAFSGKSSPDANFFCRRRHYSLPCSTYASTRSVSFSSAKTAAPSRSRNLFPALKLDMQAVRSQLHTVGEPVEPRAEQLGCVGRPVFPDHLHEP